MVAYRARSRFLAGSLLCAACTVSELAAGALETDSDTELALVISSF
ncbi:hypothetical protein PAMC26577_23575 [Caballeronia sordidicola]|uniref:Uncharacterized protein n=1 Tax=Caballeronia sordidicola TaxID=196367 RepID=A0A242MJM9_CABSO|nr:hypothetical protein PAMC26577_23575 [Caballeronia sordidicola]